MIKAQRWHEGTRTEPAFTERCHQGFHVDFTCWEGAYQKSRKTIALKKVLKSDELPSSVRSSILSGSLWDLNKQTNKQKIGKKKQTQKTIRNHCSKQIWHVFFLTLLSTSQRCIAGRNQTLLSLAQYVETCVCSQPFPEGLGVGERSGLQPRLAQKSVPFYQF